MATHYSDFQAAGLQLWNSLQSSLWHPKSICWKVWTKDAFVCREHGTSVTLFCNAWYINGLSAATVLLRLLLLTMSLDDGTAGDEGRWGHAAAAWAGGREASRGRLWADVKTGSRENVSSRLPTKGQSRGSMLCHLLLLSRCVLGKAVHYYWPVLLDADSIPVNVADYVPNWLVRKMQLIAELLLCVKTVVIRMVSVFYSQLFFTVYRAITLSLFVSGWKTIRWSFVDIFLSLKWAQFW